MKPLIILELELTNRENSVTQKIASLYCGLDQRDLLSVKNWMSTFENSIRFNARYK